MSDLKSKIWKSQKILKTIVFVCCLPFGLTILNLLFSSLFQLGIYAGTFLRFLYSIVVY